MRIKRFGKMLGICLLENQSKDKKYMTEVLK